jgi:hypothetical protein
MDPDSSPATAAARDAFLQLSGRSPLLGWMRQNHALITERMNTVRPSWDDIAGVLAGLGIRGATGAAPKTEAVRRAYHRGTGPRRRSPLPGPRPPPRQRCLHLPQRRRSRPPLASVRP